MWRNLKFKINFKAQNDLKINFKSPKTRRFAAN